MKSIAASSKRRPRPSKTIDKLRGNSYMNWNPQAIIPCIPVHLDHGEMRFKRMSSSLETHSYVDILRMLNSFLH